MSDHSSTTDFRIQMLRDFLNLICPLGLGKRMGLGQFGGHGCVGGLRGWSRAWGVVRGSHTGNGRKSSGRLTTHICLEAGMIIRHSREVRRDCVREGDGSLLLSTPIPKREGHVRISRCNGLAELARGLHFRPPISATKDAYIIYMRLLGLGRRVIGGRLAAAATIGAGLGAATLALSTDRSNLAAAPTACEAAAAPAWQSAKANLPTYTRAEVAKVGDYPSKIA